MTKTKHQTPENLKAHFKITHGLHKKKIMKANTKCFKFYNKVTIYNKACRMQVRGYIEKTYSLRCLTLEKRLKLNKLSIQTQGVRGQEIHKSQSKNKKTEIPETENQYI